MVKLTREPPPPPPTADVLLGRIYLQEAQKALERALSAWNQAQAADALGSLDYWLWEAKRAMRIKP